MAGHFGGSSWLRWTMPVITTSPWNTAMSRPTPAPTVAMSMPPSVAMLRSMRGSTPATMRPLPSLVQGSRITPASNCIPRITRKAKVPYLTVMAMLNMERRLKTRWYEPLAGASPCSQPMDRMQRPFSNKAPCSHEAGAMGARYSHLPSSKEPPCWHMRAGLWVEICASSRGASPSMMQRSPSLVLPRGHRYCGVTVRPSVLVTPGWTSTQDPSLRRRLGARHFCLQQWESGRRLDSGCEALPVTRRTHSPLVISPRWQVTSGLMG
mmetsp:Transcript_14267/g.33332  ORF Transcript_14267/g.33332 Transcript_14267/m.33332 type:complete len:266 (-) Transcript_14267:5410-6207(-)